MKGTLRQACLHYPQIQPGSGSGQTRGRKVIYANHLDSVIERHYLPCQTGDSEEVGERIAYSMIYSSLAVSLPFLWPLSFVIRRQQSAEVTFAGFYSHYSLPHRLAFGFPFVCAVKSFIRSPLPGMPLTSLAHYSHVSPI